MGERSMKTCIEEQLTVLREAVRLGPQCGGTLQDWYDDGANLAAFSDISGIDGDACQDARDDACYAWGYLSGAADLADVTVMELVDQHGLSFDEKKPRMTPIPQQQRGVLRKQKTTTKRRKAR